MTDDRPTPDYQKVIAASHYGLLGVPVSASVREVRQAYRELSKQYHPDTTLLPREVAIERFRQLNEAYAILSNPERRSIYDQKIGYSRVSVVQPLPNLNFSPSKTRPVPSSSAYLDPTDRPLSAGEVFALFILGLTFLMCLVLAITIGLTRGEAMFQPFSTQTPPGQQVTRSSAASQPSLTPLLPPAPPVHPIDSSIP
ncbi:MAG TPA: J domain-containing protein [Thermosynechococcaceae cyanobacterium]